MMTKFLIMRPELSHETREADLAPEPSYDTLKRLLAPLLEGGWLEHVSVLADFTGGTDYKPADMFIDEEGHLKRLPWNAAATDIYRRNALMRDARLKPEDLPSIVGPAILFSRRVWF